MSLWFLDWTVLRHHLLKSDQQSMKGRSGAQERAPQVLLQVVLKVSDPQF